MNTTSSQSPAGSTAGSRASKRSLEYSGGSTTSSRHIRKRPRGNSEGSQPCSKRSTSVAPSNTITENATSSTFYHDQEPFETYKMKVIQLCHDLGWGEPSEVQHMKGGSYNRIIGVKFPGRDCVLRIPRDGVDFDRSVDTKDQVAVLQHVSQQIPVALVLAFDSTKENVLGSPYALQERLGGNTLQRDFYKLPIAEKLQIVRMVAELIMKMESIRFERPGRLAANGALCSSSSNPISREKFFDITGYRFDKDGISEYMPPLENQPFMSLIKAVFEHRRRDCLDKQDGWMVGMFDDLEKIATEMEKAGLVRTTDTHYTIWHWDFFAQNIMIEQTNKAEKSPNRETAESTKPETELGLEDIQPNVNEENTHLGAPDGWKITGVLDWDGAMSVPRIMTRQPPSWLWCNEEGRTSAWSGNPDVPPARELTEEELLIKGHFDQIMQQSNPSYIEDAYFRGPWLRRLAQFALYGFSESSAFTRFDKLMAEWEEHYASIDKGNKDDPMDDESTENEEDTEEDDDDHEGEEASRSVKKWFMKIIRKMRKGPERFFGTALAK